MFCWKFWENSLKSSENHWVRFPIFVLTVFWDSTSYTVKMVLWKMFLETVIVLAGWWPCACLELASSLRRLEKRPWIFQMYLWRWLGAQIRLTHNWRRLVTAIFLLHASINAVASVKGLSFFSYDSEFRLKFSQNALWRKCLELDFQSDLTMNGLSLGFFVREWLPSLTSYLYKLKSARIAHLLIFLMTSNFFDVFFEGYSGLFFKNASTF